MKSDTPCQVVLQMIIDSEGCLETLPLDNTEREVLNRHLDDCADCKTLADEERELTLLLNSSNSRPVSIPENIHNGRPRWLANVLAVCAAIMLMACGAMLMHAWNKHSVPAVTNSNPVQGSLGSMISRPVFTDVEFTAKPRSLEDSNHIELPAGSAATITLNQAGSIDAIGPAVFGVDRVGDAWKLTLLEGQLKVVVHSESRIQLSGFRGSEELGPGTYLINFGSEQFVHTGSYSAGVQEQDEDLAEKLERGLSVFAAGANPTEQDQRDAAERLVEVFNDPNATPTQKISSGMYAVAALSNTGQFEKVIEIGTRWEQEFGTQMGEVVLSSIVKAYFSLGKMEEAKQKATQFLALYPESPYLPMVQALLGQDVEVPGNNAPLARGRYRPESQPPYVADDKSDEFVAGQADGYLVVKVGLSANNNEHQKFAAVATKVKDFHNATVLDFDGKNFNALKAEITKHKPANVMFVMPPELLDVNFHRQVFKMAPTLDNDLFADFAWGYLTARDGDALEKFWNRIKNLHENGIANKNWLETGVIGGESKSHVIDGGISSWSIDAGFRGNQLYFGCIEKDPNVIEFIDKQKTQFENAAVIAMTGNGDPQGIWLFDGMRNMDESRHWEFDKNKVGHDPENEMVRLKSDWFRKLQLQSPVIWSGTCHSGACYRVYVEGDIVSTFGKSDTAVVYDLPRDESLCLSLIDGGAGGLLVPIAANHGLAVTLESHFALKHGATLGETIKSTYDDVILQAGGIPKLLLTKEGDEPHYFSEPIMQSGGANRILIGDPALRIFDKTQFNIEEESVKVNSEKKQLQVLITWEKGYHGSAWNLFADGRGGEQRMNTRIDCTEMKSLLKGARNGSLQVEAKILNAEGKSITCAPLVEVETIGGRSYLHLQASANDRTLAHSEHRAVFNVTWE